MTEAYSILVGIIALVTLVSSALAVFVGLTSRNTVLRVERDLANFEVRFMGELDKRYVMTREHNRERDMTTKEEMLYRDDEKEKLDGLRVEVYRNRDDVVVTLNDILKLLKKE